MDSKEETAVEEIQKALQESLTPNTLLYLFQRIRTLIDLNLSSQPILRDPSLLKAIRHFLCDKEKDVRVAALRTLRYLAITEEALLSIKQAKLLHFIIRSFETEGKSHERIEACKFIKNWLELSPSSFPMSFMSALVALAETENDEDLKDFAIEAVRILSVSNTPLVSWCGGFRVLISSLFDIKSGEALVNNTILTFLFLLNTSDTRVHLKREKELSRILSVFTELEQDMRESDLDAQIAQGKRIIIMMSRSWVGLIFLASGGLRQVIENICLPIRPKIKEAILDIIEEMISIPVETSQKSQSLLKNYLAMLLKALIHCNLHRSLTQLAIEKHDPMAQRARKLLKLVTTSASDLLPDAPQFSLMLDSQKSGAAAEIVAEIDSSTRLKDNSSNRSLLFNMCEFLSKESNSYIESHNTVLIGIYKNYALNQIDDASFASLLSKSQVLREPKRWNWEIIYQIMSGPINMPQRFMQAHKSKFLRCLLSFYMPSRGLFNVLNWHPDNFVKAQVGALLIGILLSQPEGMQQLTTKITEGFFILHKSFIQEITDAIDEEISVQETGKSSNTRLFSPNNTKTTMVREYLKWIGLMFFYRTGVALLSSSNIDSKLIKLSTVEHISTVLIPHLNYQEHVCKDFLSFSLQSANNLVRKHAMEHLRLMFRAGIFELTWAMREIVNQLYSRDLEIVTCALSVVAELCHDSDNLRTFIETGPQTLTRLGEEGSKCLISFLSSSPGINYLSQLNFIQKELDIWRKTGNLDYVRKIEHKSEQGLTSQKKVYALEVHTPFGNSYNDRVEPLWLRKLPFTIIVYVSSTERTYPVNTWVNISEDEVFITSAVKDIELNDNDFVSSCLQIGIYNIDSKGQETLDCNWVKCAPQDRDFDGSEEVQKFGVTFKFRFEGKRQWLKEVSYRVQILPKASPSIKFPKHLYGELVQTRLGLKKLQESGHAEELVQAMVGEGSIIQKRVALWGLGHIGSSERGVQFLNRLGAISSMIEIAEKSTTLSLRGTAFQALCLLANTAVGRKELLRYGWICSQANIALPAQSEKIFWLEDENNFENFRERCLKVECLVESIPLSSEEQEVLANIVGLGNFVRRGEAEIYLKAKRQSNPAAFEGVNLFHAVMTFLTVYSFKINTRKIIHKLFEKIHRKQQIIVDLDQFDHI